jgi:hypothetical protein
LQEHRVATRNGSSFAGLQLVHLLLLVTAAELAINRLAVPTLRPAGTLRPPGWHQVLDHIGLFLLFFGSTLALGVIGRQLLRVARGRYRYWALPRYGLPFAGLAFLALATVAIALNPGEQTSFLLETAFALTVVLIVSAQLTQGGDIGAKIGVVLLAAPLIIHYYAPFALTFLEGEEGAWGDLPIRVQALGQWSLVFAALVSPYCFAPRPFVQSAARLGPLAVATFVGLVGAVVLRQHYEVGMLMASRGLGVELGPGAPTHHIALYLMALGAVTWTLASCFAAPSRARNQIGVGIALLVCGGYGFAWPLHYLVSVAGLLTISGAGTRVSDEEQSATERSGFLPPPIADEVWQRYVTTLLDTFSKGTPVGSRKPATMTARGEDGEAVTHILAERRGHDVKLRVTRYDGSIVAVEMLCGIDNDSPGQPSWTLYARPERLLGVRAHPEPPATDAPVVKTGDQSFDQRFRMRDGGKHADALLDEELRSRATALIDGWVAYWPGSGIQCTILPGRGAPLDHPIPITELAFRGEGAPLHVERLVTLIDLLAEMVDRTTPDDTPNEDN